MKKNPKGIGGWLILPTIGLFLSIIIYLILAVIEIAVVFLGAGTGWDIIYLLTSAGMFGLVVYTLVLEFKKKKEFPKWAIILTALGVVVTIIFSIEDSDYTGLVQSIVFAAIWIGYFLQSKRVKNTFTE